MKDSSNSNRCSMGIMAADEPKAAQAEDNRHQHPLMYLHANESAPASNIARVKREMKPNQSDDAREKDEAKVKMMNSNKASSSSRTSSMKSIIIITFLLLVLISLHSMLQTFEVIDNKIATSAILLHHCHSFLVTSASIASKIFYALKDIILVLIASLSSASSRSNNNAQTMVMEQFQSRLQKGQQLLAQYKDVSGSEMVCKSVANAIVITVNDRKQTKGAAPRKRGDWFSATASRTQATFRHLLRHISCEHTLLNSAQGTSPR